MQTRFRDVGDPPTLFSAFLYFDMSFMVWVLLGPLGVQIGRTLHLRPAQLGFMVAVPLASRWYPPEHQGTALGIAGAGNSGTTLAALFAPGLAVASAGRTSSASRRPCCWRRWRFSSCWPRTARAARHRSPSPTT